MPALAWRPTEKEKNQIDRMMGNSAWIEPLYKFMQPDFSGDESVEREILPAKWLADLYVKQAAELFAYVSNPVIMRNSQNAAMYSLFVASHNPTATKITNEIYAKYERTKRPARATKKRTRSGSEEPEQTSFL